MKLKDEKLGELAAIGHLILDGFWPVGAAYGTQTLGLGPVGLLGSASFFASFFFLYLVWRRRRFSQILDAKYVPECILYTLCLLLPYVAIFYAAKYSSALDIALLTQSEIIFAALIGFLFLHEKIRANRVLGILMIFSANILVLYNGELQMNTSSLVLVFAPTVFVIGNAIAKRLQKKGLDFSALLFFRSFFGGGTLLVVSAFIEPAPQFSMSLLMFLFGFGFFAFGLPKALWQIALNKIDLSKTTAIGLSYPAFSFLFAYILIGEVPNFYQWLALIFSLSGIVVLTRVSSDSIEKLSVEN